jgi:preprotein translocase subunit SecE
MAVTARRRNERDQEFPPFRFLRETYEELRKVVWPTPAELYRYTLVVVITVVVIAAFIGAVDLALSEISKRWIYAAVKAG